MARRLRFHERMALLGSLQTAEGARPDRQHVSKDAARRGDQGEVQSGRFGIVSEPEALAMFHEWADNRRRKSWPVALVRLWAAWALLQISSGASWLARKAVPTP